MYPDKLALIILKFVVEVSQVEVASKALKMPKVYVQDLVSWMPPQEGWCKLNTNGP